MNVTFEVEACAMQKQAYNPVKKDLRRGKTMKNDKYCTHCKIKRHKTKACFKIHGYPEWYKQKYRAKMAAQISTQDSQEFESPQQLGEN